MKSWYMTKENKLKLTPVYKQITNADGTKEMVWRKQFITVSDMEALRVRIDAALQVVKGELDDNSKGVDYFGIVFSNTPLSMKVQEISRVILAQDGVKDVKFERAEHNKLTQALTFYFTIESEYGLIEYNRTFENM